MTADEAPRTDKRLQEITVAAMLVDMDTPECNETARARSARRSRIIGEVYDSWVAEHVANGTFQKAIVGEVNGEENGELASLSAEADGELHRRTTAALQAAGLTRTIKRAGDR